MGEPRPLQKHQLWDGAQEQALAPWPEESRRSRPPQQSSKPERSVPSSSLEKGK